MKSLKEISLDITEEQYRNDGRMHYSTLAKFDRTGFNGLETLFDKVESPSLTFGSVVDELITGTQESFNEKFLVAEFPKLEEKQELIIKEAFALFNETYDSFNAIPSSDIIPLTEQFEYRLGWKAETRVKVLKEVGEEYYNILFISKNKTIITQQTYQEACNTAQALKTSIATKWYFEDNNPFDKIERLYQLKFAATFDDITYSIMADLIIVNHKTKEIFPIDLKTSSKPEWDFYKSFIDWSYSHQARLYYRVLKDNLKKDSYFKDFTIHNYRFIVANKKTLIPLVWEYNDTKEIGTLHYGKDKNVEIRDPFEIAKELSTYMEYECSTPMGITLETPNNIEEWLNR